MFCSLDSPRPSLAGTGHGRQFGRRGAIYTNNTLGAIWCTRVVVIIWGILSWYPGFRAYCVHSSVVL